MREEEEREEQLLETPVVQEVHTGTPPGGPGPTSPAPGSAVDPSQFSRSLLNAAFGILAMRLGEHWKLQPLELETLGDAMTPVSKRLLEHVTDFWAELAIVVVVGWPIVQLRWAKQLVIEKAEQARAAEKAKDKPQPPTPPPAPAPGAPATAAGAPSTGEVSPDA